MFEFYIRALDILIALLALIVLAAFLGTAGLLVRATGCSIIFRQKRNGKQGSVFTIYKFCTMWVMEDGEEQFKPASFKDDRTTTICAFMRHDSVDELPRLLNLLKGKMSIVSV
jgi:lipopolysaccharide/colanic/teichoic acid biosynthesis glycosyltransferase